jgi:hypothetical protein
MTLPAILPGTPPVIVTGENTAEAMRQAGIATAAASARNRVVTLTSGSAPNTLTGTTDPAMGGLATGQLVMLTPAATNTGAVTLDLDGLGAKEVYSNSGALKAGQLVAGQTVGLHYTGFRWRMDAAPASNTLGRAATSTDNYQRVDPYQLALETRRAPAALTNVSAADPNAQTLTATPSLGAYYPGTILAWRPSTAPTADEFTLNIDGLGPMPVYGRRSSGAAFAVGTRVQPFGTYLLAINQSGATTFLTITGALPATEAEAAAGSTDLTFLTPQTARAGARPEALFVNSEILASTGTASGLRYGYSFQRPPLDSWRKWKFFDLDLERVIAWDGSELTFEDTGETLAWYEAEDWAAGAYQVNDFVNEEYRMDGASVTVTDIFSADISARTGTADGLTFDGTTGNRVQILNTVIQDLVALGALSFAMEVKAANFDALATLLDFAATSSSSSNRIQLQRRPLTTDVDGETQLSRNLQFTATTGGTAVQLRLAPGDGTTDAIWIYGSVSDEHVRAADYNGAGEVLDDVSGFPVSVGKGYLGATQGTASQPFEGSILRLAFWRKERPAPQEAVRERHVTTFNGTNFIHQTPQEPHSMRFLGKVADSPVRVELKSGDQRAADAASYAGRVEFSQETDMVQGTEYWFGYTMFMPHFEFEATDDIAAYLITMQNHGQSGREPWCDLKWLNGVPHVRAQHIAAGGGAQTLVVDQTFDFPLQQENYLLWNWKTADDGTGFFKFWFNGDQLVDYSGPVGWMDEATGGYSKFGLYRPANIDGDYSVAAIYDNVRHSTEDLSSLIYEPEPIRSVNR